jgi:2-dehydropantoate 2-reductase
MRFAIVGSGAVGGYYGAKLAHAGHDVTFLARGAHLAAIREHGLSIASPLGDFTVKSRAEEDPARVPPVDVAIYAVKTYSNDTALALLKGVVRDPETVALTLQNGVESADEVAATVGRERTLAGSTYIATGIARPGLIEQTGTHRRIVFGEVGEHSAISHRVQRINESFLGADIVSEAVADARIPIWEKFCYLAPFAGFTGASRLPIGPIWSEPSSREMLIRAFGETEQVARAEGVALLPGVIDRIGKYIDSIPPATKSSLLIDLTQGKPIEVEALLGAVVRRGRRVGIDTPVMAALYAVLKPHARGAAA